MCYNVTWHLSCILILSDMIPGEVAASTTAHDEEHEEENEDDDEDDEESLDLDDMDAEYDHDFDVYHDPEEYVQVGVPYGGWSEYICF